MVRLAPGDEQLIRHVREEGVALAEHLRNASPARQDDAGSSPAAAGAAKPGRPATIPSGRPAQRPGQSHQNEVKQRAGEPASMQRAAAGGMPETARMPAGVGAGPTAARDAKVTPVAMVSDNNEAGALSPPSSPAQAAASGLPVTQVPSRLWPAAFSSSPDAPRPPLDVAGSAL
jgi:hypothetical protein